MVGLAHLDMHIRHGIGVLFVLIALQLAGCANPSPPTGGPQDTTPPVLEHLVPADDSVNVPLDIEIEMEFDKYIERGTMAGAFSMTPEPEIPPEFDFSGRRITISFPEPLSDSTTYIVELGTDLRDVRNVNLNEPLIFAFSTGPEIDEGRIEGEILDPEWGDPEEGVNVFAYAVGPDAQAPPDSLPEEPDFRTETGSDGTFLFRNIREEQYYVIGVRDVNRNRFPDPDEAFAVPPVPIITARPEAEPVPVPWLLYEPEPAPRAERVRPRTTQRQYVRFNIPVEWTERDASHWVLVDSVAQDTISLGSVYRSDETPFEVGVATNQPLTERVHRLSVPPNALADAQGRPVPDTTFSFTPSTREDEAEPEWIGFRPERSEADDSIPLLEDEAPALRVTLPLADEAWNETITATDTLGQSRTLTPTSEDGLQYRLETDPPLDVDMPLDFAVDGEAVAEEDTVFTQRFHRLTVDDLGELETTLAYDVRPWPERDPDDGTDLGLPISFGITVPDSLWPAPPAGPPSMDVGAVPDIDADTLAMAVPGVLRVEIHDESNDNWPTRHVEADAPGLFRVERIPEGQFRFRVLLDRDNTGYWSPGQIAPYAPADLVTWSQQPIEGRARWTNVLEETLRLIELTDE